MIDVKLIRSNEKTECSVCNTGIDEDYNCYEVSIKEQKRKICIDCGNEFAHKFDEAHEEMYGW